MRLRLALSLELQGLLEGGRSRRSNRRLPRASRFAVTLVPETYVAESLVERFAGQAAGKKILLARAEVARDVIPDALRAAGATVDVVDAYRNAMPEAAPELLREALATESTRQPSPVRRA